MVTLRLTRLGVKNQPKYRIVAIDSREKRDGKYIEELGFYDPTVSPSSVKLNKDRYSYWTSVGAKPSKTVSSLYRHFSGRH
ncbi:MAG: 30S ribosomal protein S16 [Candidatus Woykebacteria bacterium RIFCSPHIGHO2_12_FULL_43_10]|uniref:Small ribosomal subunit protein bS16 n=2 Tax=Candidatus Woykeibacteriota TaxID=1817899 RepID=A0A1G1WX88_9BACT|nr:MAG: 30S ribosomal protein S16 [Candidatus Woykebacteria bacterium RIFCSPHIGHO2_02_FULL_43_16b]OGY28640.1 MAG: 30S ribosomal protein S16 [Candidatus Woykebacteria bacterium RIFCSPHIGHO2_01_FULL_43_29]OGY29050.1 MAG: 30S ribosomal protein S16 [Candidatus Woykebacteria bacterium RIFCSPHIGHO2_12_FULL_43_10]OGY32181.1 MAG: 30S ribosomal protein S16 [Candidatus Woykebacteria bacterium RIFCSPLOWO2_01_FULL_43_14]